MYKRNATIQSELNEEIQMAIRELTDIELGCFLDDIYLKLEKHYDSYNGIVNKAFDYLMETLSSNEIKKECEVKLIMNNSLIGRPRCDRELAEWELGDEYPDESQEEWSTRIIRKPVDYNTIADSIMFLPE